MQKIPEQVSFLGSMNKDAAKRLLPQNDWRQAFNVRIGSSRDGNMGGVETLRGTKEICCSLPSGVNTAIGSESDDLSGKIVAFYHNDQGNHSIVVYDMKNNECCILCQGPELNFRLDWPIHSIDIIDGNQLRYTDGNILDGKPVGNPPGGFNMDFANKKNLKLKYEFHSDDINSSSYQVIINDVVLLNFTGTFQALGEAMKSLSQVMEVKVCDCEILEICLLNNGDVLKIDSLSSSLLIPTNHYCGDFKDVCVKPPCCAPIVGYKKAIDSIKDVDKITGKTFQFRVQYEYCDGSSSSLGPISQVAVPTLDDCSNCGIECITLDITDPLLLDPCSNICKVNIIVREGNNGQWYEADSLRRGCFGVDKQEYCFYNRNTQVAIPDKLEQKKFDRVPKIALSQAFVGNKLMYGSFVEGQDLKPCTEDNISIKKVIETDCRKQIKLWTIKGRIRIANLLDETLSDPFRSNQPIWFDGEDKLNGVPGVKFGGLSDGDRQLSGEEAGQWIPEGGFTVYLAKTNFRATSKQVVKGDVIVYNGETGTYSADVPRGEDEIKKLIKDGCVYQEFEIKGVCPGKYFMRVASHLVSTGDVLGMGAEFDLNNGLEWQNTSTYTAMVAGQINELSDGTCCLGNEACIELGDQGGILDLSTDPSYGDTIILDLTSTDKKFTPAFTLGNTEGLKIRQGYLINTFGVVGPTGLDNFVRVEKQKYEMDFQFFGFNSGPPSLSVNGNSDIDNRIVKAVSLLANNHCGWTDHNGFWFWFAHRAELWSSNLVLFGGIQFISAVPINPNFYCNNDEISTTDYYSPTEQLNNEWIDVFSDGTNYGRYTNVILSQDLFNNCWTRVEGKVYNQEDCGVEGIMVCIEGVSRSAITDNNGCFSILVHACSGELFNSQKIIMQYPCDSACCINEFPLVIDVQFPINQQGHNSTNYFNILKALVTTESRFTPRYLKKGGVYRFGKLYRDQCGRSEVVEIGEICIPSDKDSEVLYVPYYEIFSEAPDWAKTYEIVRTLDLRYSQYEQWAIGDVKYIRSNNITINEITGESSFDEASFDSGSAKYIYLGIGNLFLFNQDNQQSILNYAPEGGSYFGFNVEAGDYIRVIDNKGGDSLSGDCEAKVIGIFGEYVAIENRSGWPQLQPGAIIEFRKEASAAPSERIMYGTGLCYPIISGLHLGGIEGQDQADSNPATGCVIGGDTYSRTRIIPLGTYDERGPNCTVRVESPSASDFYPSNVEDIGVACLYDPDNGETFVQDQIIFSDIYAKGINGLSSFDPLDFIITDIENGPIRKLVVVGDVLLAYHANKVHPFYQGQSLARDTSGNGVFISDPSLLNKGRPLMKDWGTQDPCSVLKHEGLVYAYDRSKGVFHRYSNNGLVNLGDRKMNSEFDAICKNLGGGMVVTGYDQEYDEVLLTIGKNEDCNPATYVYSAGEQGRSGWTNIREFAPKKYSSLGKRTFAFLGGAMHELNEGEQGIFFGKRLYSRITTIFNQYPNTSQNYYCLEQFASELWVTTVRGITTEGKNNQETQLRSDKAWECVEDRFIADIRRDMNSDGGLFNGDQMKGLFLEVEFEFTGESDSVLYNVVAYSGLSGPTS